MAASEVDFVLVDSRAMLRDVFPLLDEGTEAIFARCPDETTCAGDLYAAALRGECELRLLRIDERVVGFLATTTTTSLNGDRSLFVWMLYVEPGVPNTIGEVVTELDFMATEQGCTAVQFCTTRPGWERRLAPLGFHAHSIQLRREVGQ
ncbi:hypothetical protein [Vreelandella massiliensis]|uniref:hypothetical protein n=1 Tax=Vreelandella massiliensis TaxID=1816686 RepID=UPI00096A39C4|nr:hypothetical protein [Halomonas massiliensis]